MSSSPLKLRMLSLCPDSSHGVQKVKGSPPVASNNVDFSSSLMPARVRKRIKHWRLISPAFVLDRGWSPALLKVLRKELVRLTA